ncbi:MAG: sodium:solute symporter [Phycisphaerae bacterium]|nr:sodium:solute symporter [Phycisphaerae bacterium]
MDHLNNLDYFLIIIYFAFLIVLAFILNRRASASIEDYFIGGRKLPWWLLGMSGMTQFVDIAGTSVIISLLFFLGPKELMISLRGGLAIHMAAIMIWSGKWHRRSGCVTGAEWTIFRFGNGAAGKAARIVTAIAIPIFIIGMVSYMSTAVGIFFSMFVPFQPWVCSLTIISIACLYTAASGFYGVVFTDLFQAIIILLAVIVITVLAISKTWFTGDFPALAEKVTGMSNWISCVPKWKVNMPSGYEQYNSIGMLAIFYLFKAAIVDGFGGGGEPKYFGARSDRECGTLTFLWANMMVFRWPLMIGCTILGIFLINDKIPNQAIINESAAIVKIAFPETEEHQWKNKVSDITNNPEKYPNDFVSELQTTLGDDWKTKLMLTNYKGNLNTEKILPAVIIHSIPAGLKGLILIALLAACMSTFDSNVNFAVGFLTRDIYQGFIRPKAASKELIRMSWFFTFFIAFSGYTMAYYIKSIDDIWSFLMMGLGAGFMVPGLIKFYWWRYNGWGFAGGMAMGMLFAIIQRFVPAHLWISMQEAMPSVWNILESIPKDILIFISITILGVIGAVLGSLLTKPVDEEVLRNFYIKTKPFGFWGPLKNSLDAQTRAKVKREHFYDLVALPFVVAWQYLLLLLPVLLVMGNFKEAKVVTIFFVVALIGVYLFWYRNLPKENMYDSENKIS